MKSHVIGMKLSSLGAFLGPLSIPVERIYRFSHVQSRRKTLLLKNCKFYMYTIHWFTMVIKSLDILKLA